MNLLPLKIIPAFTRFQAELPYASISGIVKFRVAGNLRKSRKLREKP